MSTGYGIVVGVALVHAVDPLMAPPPPGVPQRIGSIARTALGVSRCPVMIVPA